MRISIPPDEIRARQARLREACEERGWRGVAVLGRGGGTYDRHGDLMYVSGHYQAYVHLADRPPLWSGRSHALFVLPLEGASVLLCSAPDVDAAVADEVRVTSDFRGEAAALLTRLGGGGFSGFDVASAGLGLPLEAFAPAEAVIERMRRRKSPAEQALLRHVCRVGTAAVEALMAAAEPGATEGAAVGAAAAVAFAAGAPVYLVTLAGDRGGRYTGRTLPGFRPERSFAAGELARLDLVIVYEGYYCDFGRSWVVGGTVPGTPAGELVAAARAGLDAATAAAVPGATAGDVARAGAAALPAGVETSYPPHWGHGLGMGWEGPWLLADNDERLEAGYALAIETAVRRDGLVAGGELDVLVGEAGAEILTPASWP